MIIIVFAKKKLFIQIGQIKLSTPQEFLVRTCARLINCTHAREKPVDNFLILAIFLLFYVSSSCLVTTSSNTISSFPNSIFIIVSAWALGCCYFFTFFHQNTCDVNKKVHNFAVSEMTNPVFSAWE